MANRNKTELVDITEAVVPVDLLESIIVAKTVELIEAKTKQLIQKLIKILGAILKMKELMQFQAPAILASTPQSIGLPYVPLLAGQSRFFDRKSRFLPQGTERIFSKFKDTSIISLTKAGR